MGDFTDLSFEERQKRQAQTEFKAAATEVNPGWITDPTSLVTFLEADPDGSAKAAQKLIGSALASSVFNIVPSKLYMYSGSPITNTF
jgi:hypothetical protein